MLLSTSFTGCFPVKAGEVLRVVNVLSPWTSVWGRGRARVHEGCWDPLDTRGLVHSDETDAADRRGDARVGSCTTGLAGEQVPPQTCPWGK